MFRIFFLTGALTTSTLQPLTQGRQEIIGKNKHIFIRITIGITNIYHHRSIDIHTHTHTTTEESSMYKAFGTKWQSIKIKNIHAGMISQ